MSNMRDAAFLNAGLRSACDKAYDQLQFEFEPATGTLWGYMNQVGTPCYNLGLLNAARAQGADLAASGGRIQVQGNLQQVNYFVAASRIPKVFNLGGDLALFLLLIKSRDREALAHYARLCIDNLHARIVNFSCPSLTTISLVQGDALGGGFESALSSDVVIAEESAQMGFPEILFNLFPGMGACSLLARRIGIRAAEELVLSGKILTAAELHRLGVVDVLATDGQGETAVRNWIARNAKRRNGLQAVLRARHLIHPVRREELDGIVELWVDAAMRLRERDLKMMGRLVRAQARRMESGESLVGAGALVAAEVAA